MKDGEEYEDYLVDKAKELLDEQTSDIEDKTSEKPEMKNKQNELDEKAEQDSTSNIPYAFDPREIKHLANNRKEMSNQEMEEFLKKDSELHEELQEVDDWNGFNRWEERFLVQNHLEMDPKAMADQLDRDEKEVKLKMRMLGIKPEEL